MKTNFLTLILVLCVTFVSAQTFQLKPDESKMTIKGTSTLHDWESEVESISASAEVEDKTIRRGTFEAEVRSIKSGNSTMDDNTYKAMDADKYPKIFFSMENQKLEGGKMPVSGKLTIAGTTRTVDLSLIAEQWAEDQLLLKGVYTFDMSDFGIDPPRAMLGAIRTDDEITVEFSIALQR